MICKHCLKPISVCPVRTRVEKKPVFVHDYDGLAHCFDDNLKVIMIFNGTGKFPAIAEPMEE